MIEPPWRETALELFPELMSRFERADTSYLLWFELMCAFEEAYEAIPPNESLIRRIYQYADWCNKQPRGKTADDDLATCVAVCFCEHIPQIPKARADMPRWWRSEDLAGDRNIFGYHLGRDEFKELKLFIAREWRRYDPSLRNWKTK